MIQINIGKAKETTHSASRDARTQIRRIKK